GNHCCSTSEGQQRFLSRPQGSSRREGPAALPGHVWTGAEDAWANQGSKTRSEQASGSQRDKTEDRCEEPRRKFEVGSSSRPSWFRHECRRDCPEGRLHCAVGLQRQVQGQCEEVAG